MWLEDFVPSESADAGPKSAEVSEKFKESIKKSQAGIKRVQKDEKKAKKYDVLLAHFLVEIIKNPKYDFLLKDLFSSLDHGYPSNFLLWILSLIYIEISHKIREVSLKEKITFFYEVPQNPVEFQGNNIDKNIQVRINQWLEDIGDIVKMESSSLQISHMLEIHQISEAYDSLLYFTTKAFQFFFQELSITLWEKQAQSYSEFILSEVFKKIEKLSFEEV